MTQFDSIITSRSRRTTGLWFNKVARAAAFCLLPLVFAQPIGAADAPPMVLRMAHYQPEQRVLMRAVKWWSDEVEKRSNGRIKIKHYFSGQLAKAGEILPLIRQGGLDMGTPALAYYASDFPLTQVVVDYPWSTIDELLWVVPKLIDKNPLLKAEWEKNNVVPLSWGALPPYGVVTTKGAGTLSALKGCKIRVWGQYMPMFMIRLGTIPVSMPSSATYEAMAKGTVDCTLSPPDQHRALGLHEVAKNHIVGDFAPALLAAQPMMNAQQFHKLAPDLQKVFMDVRADHFKKLKQLLVETDEADRQFLMDKGVKFTRLPEADNKSLRDASMSVWKELTLKSGNQDAVNKIKQAIQTARTEYESQK